MCLQGLDLRSLAAFAVEAFNAGICQLVVTGKDIRSNGLNRVFNEKTLGLVQKIVTDDLDWMGSMPVHQDRK